MAGLLALGALAACKEEAHFMTLSEKKFSIGEDGGTLNVDLSTNVYTRIVNDNDFVKIEEAAVEGSTTSYVITVDPNTEDKVRTARIKFIGDYVTPLALDITQAAKIPVGVSVNEITLNKKETSAIFKVLGEKDWTAVCDNPWFTLSRTEGSGETTVTVTCAANDTGKDIAGTITVTIAGEKFTIALTHFGTINYIDLSAEKQSNCYIISESGYYKFNAAIRGNGVVPESFAGVVEANINPDHAGVLWCTNNTTTAPEATTDFITEIELQNGYVQFGTAKPVPTGSAVIAVYSADNTILWSWHIWFTEQPAISEIGGAYWMDRDLGATCANITGDVRSCGFFYQWGRKDPMRGPATWEADFIATTPELVETVLPESAANCTIETSIQHPTAFIENGTVKDWIYTKDHTDRWMDSQKTMFDPCPAGYKVPSNAQFVNFSTAAGLPEGAIKYSSNATAKAAYKTEQHVFDMGIWSLPLCGFIQYNNGGQIDGVCGTGCRYNSSTAGTGTNGTYLNINSSALNFSNAATRGHASAVRCVKE